MAFAALFSACGDDSGSNSSRREESSPEVAELELANGKAVVCDDDMEGVVAITADDGYRKCVDGEWIKIKKFEAMKADKIIGQLEDDDDDISDTDPESSSSQKQSSSSKKPSILDEDDDDVIPNSSNSVILSSNSVIPSEVEGSSSSKGGSSVIYECPDGTVVANLENCKTPSSSSSDTPNTSASETPGTSSGVIPGTDPESSSDEAVDLSYATKCPAGHTCTYAPTEYLNPKVTYGELLDERDYQMYKTVEICDKNDKNCQTWMAQNLNYDPGNVSSMGSYAWSGCYGDESENCSKYGRLYTWEVAMNKAECGYGTYCNNSYEGTQGVCPAGWHLPSNGEWSALYDNIGGTSNAGSLLKSTSGWNYGGNGTDKYGFSVLPAGYRYDRGYFTSSGNNAYFWSSSENDRSIAWRQHFDYRAGYVDQYDSYEDVAFSIRCLKDSPDQGGEASNSSSSGSSASETPNTSASETPDTDPESPSEVKDDGYYKTNCPAGLDCKYATTTDYLNSTKTYGEVLDTRDGQVYKTIVICDKDNKNCQTWMAQNLNYAYTGVKYNYSGYTSDSTSWCYHGVPSNCATFGRLYTWAAAVDSVAIYKNYGEECGYGKSCSRFSATVLATAPVRGVCPSGWHLPTREDWQKLVKPMANSVDDHTTYWYYNGAGIELKTVDAWYSSSDKGTNASGFSALPAGYRYSSGSFDGAGNEANFWSASEYRDNIAYDLSLYYISGNASLGGYSKGYGFSVRCLKD